jgi:methionyl-tRNA formyltransferase
MRIVFMGTPQAAVPTLEKILSDGHEVAAVYTQPDRPSGRGNKIAFSPVKQLALDKALTVVQPIKIKTEEALNEFRSFNADVAVVVAYGRILPKTFLGAFPHGAVNVHFSLLPKYRGAAPVNWAIVNGEAETGITTMNMDVGLDTGDILLQYKTKIGEDENSVDLMSRLAVEGAELLSVTLRDLATISPEKQNDSLATHAPLMSKDDGHFQWMMTAEEISRRVRGFQPFPTTYTKINDKKLTLWKVAPVEAEVSVEPGTVLTAHGDDLVIACGRLTAIRISEIQLEGKRRMSVRDFLNGIRIEEGKSLSDQFDA